MFILSLFTFLCISVGNANGVCTWPSQFVNSTWIDSQKGELVFGTTTMTGFKIDINTATNRNSWECYNNTGDYLIMRTTQTFVLFVTNIYTGYRCLKLKKVSDYSYRYYELNPPQSQLKYDRVDIADTSSTLNATSLCNSQLGASGSEFQVMIKKSKEAAAALTCPYNLLSNYDFLYASSDASVSCTSSDKGFMNMCSNVTRIGMAPLACSSTPLYSTSQNIWCVDIVTLGTGIYVSLYNGDQVVATIDNSTTYRFTCLGMNAAGTSMSVTPKHCKSNQTATVIPKDNYNNSVGAVLSLTSASARCPPCPILKAPLRGSFTVTTDGAVTTATYVCDGTYTLSGSETRICQGNGTWSGTDPTCACPIPDAPTNGSVIQSSDGLMAYFTCDTWFVLQGAANLTCNTVNNTWIGSNPTCAACQSLTLPSNGSYTVTSTGLTSVVTFSCDVGTTLNGATSRTCLKTTAWNSTTPKCTSCPTLSNISSGYVNVTSDGTTTKAVYTCVSGYRLSGDGDSTCQTAGTWNKQPPSCICNIPSTPANGTVAIYNDTQAVYTCNMGFTLSGQMTRTCQTDGTGWSYSDPLCVGCTVLSAPSNGSVSLSTNGTLTVAAYTCNVGFSMSGSMTSYCQKTGTWSTPVPSCSKCDDLPSVTFGNYTLTTDGSSTLAQFSCGVGTTISGDVIISCDANGHWSFSTSNTTCVKCPDLSNVTGGQYSLTTNGTISSAKLSCKSGYTLSGTSILQCQSNGSWTESQSQCVSVSASPVTEDGGGANLVPAVVVLAILAALFATAFVGALIYIRKIKNAISENEKSKEKGPPAYPFPSAKAPLNHMQHIMDARHTSLSMAAPVSHNTTPAPSRMDMTSVTPRTMTSVSAGSLLFDLVRENTTSSVIFTPDNPAPWSRKSTRQVDDFEPTGVTRTETFPPTSRGFFNITKEERSPRKKGNKQPITKKMQRQSSQEGQGGEQSNNVKHTPSPKPRRQKTGNIENGGVKSVYTEANGTVKVPRLNLSGQPERASTPVNHGLEVRDPKPVTPRSNVIATVQ